VARPLLGRRRSRLARPGRPPKLNETARQFLVDTLPADVGVPMTTWSLRDVQGVLERDRGIQVRVATVQRALHARGLRYRRPRHDVPHRQDADAVASMQQGLAWLEKKALLQPSDAIWSLRTSVRSTPILGWQRSGSDTDNR
jgi:hypothetical protein